VVTAYIKIGEFKGNLGTGITIPVKIPKVTGSISLFVKDHALWIRFDLTVFGKHFSATLKLVNLPFLKEELKEVEEQNVLKGFEASSINAVEAA